MCSVTIFIQDGNVIVTMNRDESVERPQEIPPEPQTLGFYPKDSLAGGTWCGLSPQGEAYCLLNRYDDTDSAARISRGKIIPTLLVGSELPHFNNFDSFSLIRFSVSQGQLTAWDGRQASEEKISALPYFFTSSGFEREQVLPYRRKLFADFTAQNPTPDPQSIFAFHSTIDEKREYGIFAERQNSHTKSVLQFTIGSAQLNYRASYRYFRRDGLAASGQVEFGK